MLGLGTHIARYYYDASLDTDSFWAPTGRTRILRRSAQCASGSGHFEWEGHMIARDPAPQSRRTLLAASLGAVGALIAGRFGRPDKAEARVVP